MRNIAIKQRASLSANDLNRFGSTWQVSVQADLQLRLEPDQISQLKARNDRGEMVLLPTLARVKNTAGPDRVMYYNGFLTAEINGATTPSYSFGQGEAAIARRLGAELPNGMTEEAGLDRVAAVLEAYRLRLRPILMASIAFVMGVVPRPGPATEGSPCMIHKVFAPTLLTLALSACAVGPDYSAPEIKPALLASAGSVQVDRARFERLWWQQFDDPTLNQLVQAALKENRELRVAFARFKAARALRDDVANDQLPTITSRTSADIGKAQQPGFGEQRVNVDRYDLGLDMAWELDLFGRIQRQLEASEALSEATEAALYQLQVSLIAELVDAYGNLRGAQLRGRIARDNLKNQQESRALTEQLRDAGLGSELDVLRSEARLAATESSLPQLQADEARARNRIATLLGQRPEQLTVDLSPKPLPVIAKALPIGDPAELLRRRPDVRSAERQLAAATANVGVATADLFPRVSLSGFLGFTAGRGSQIGSSVAQAWSVAPTISWAAFDLGSVRGRLRGAEADADGALALYEQQVLLALEESENAFNDFAKRQQRLVSLVRQAEASRAAAEVAAIRYREGAEDFLVLLDAERERLAAEDAQALGEVELYRGVVAIYKALGGGWQPQA